MDLIARDCQEMVRFLVVVRSEITYHYGEDTNEKLVVIKKATDC